jgi:hypothetical protein
VKFPVPREEGGKEGRKERRKDVREEGKKMIHIITETKNLTFVGSKLETQEGDGASSSQSQRSPKAREDCCPSSRTGREKTFFQLILFILFKPSLDRMMLIHVEQGNLFQSTNSRVNVIQKHPHRHTQK